MNETHWPQLAFFGRMNAHISHELKNIFATISETSGLLVDLMSIHGMDKGPQGERLVQICERITGLVDRGNGTVQNMNRFSHSSDEFVKDTDLCELLRLMVGLSAYMPYTRKIELDIPDAKSVLRTSPYLLMSLMYDLLAPTFKQLDLKASIQLSLTSNEDNVVLGFNPGPLEISHETQELVTRLNGSIEQTEQGIRLILHPYSADG